MFKLIIADDERIIRETIANLIDWKEFGIEVIGLCKDGLETYDMIMDKSPDIALIDIKMPHLTGLEVIQKVYQNDISTHFILLSGYGEFDYAREVMRYGVKHYLLKPCNEEQIKESIRSVVADSYHTRAFNNMQEQQRVVAASHYMSIVTAIINDAVAANESEYDNVLKHYECFLDFKNTDYELCYLHFLEENNLADCLEKIYQQARVMAPNIPIYCIYIKNTLIIFFMSYELSYENWDTFMKKLHITSQSVEMEYRRESYVNLTALLKVVFEKVRRYGTIYCMNGLRAIPTCNYKGLIEQAEKICYRLLEDENCSKETLIGELLGIFEGIQNADFLKQMIASLLIRVASNTINASPIKITEFLLILGEKVNTKEICAMAEEQIRLVVAEKEKSEYSGIVGDIIRYVSYNLSQSNLTLKWLAENYLYMNVDYVGKKFIKETGNKFSAFLTEKRIEKAREILVTLECDNVNQVAEEVGCGNNPQYFSQIFKKYTGMTPYAYARKMKSE